MPQRDASEVLIKIIPSYLRNSVEHYFGRYGSVLNALPLAPKSMERSLKLIVFNEYKSYLFFYKLLLNLNLELTY